MGGSANLHGRGEVRGEGSRDRTLIPHTLFARYAPQARRDRRRASPLVPGLRLAVLIAVALAVAWLPIRATAAAGGAAADAAPAASLDAGAFLAGHWCSPPDEGGDRIEEHYLPPRDGLEARAEGADGDGFGWRMESCDGPPFLVVPMAGTEPPAAPDPRAADGTVAPDLVALATWPG